MRYKIRFRIGDHSDYDAYDSQLYHWVPQGDGISIRKKGENRNVAYYFSHNLISVTEIDLEQNGRKH
jgi:hypothetical protein